MKIRSFAGKVAAITGAGSGMGRALAVMLAERGCALGLSDVDEVALAATASMAKGVRTSIRKLDVADADNVHTWAGEVVRDHGKVNLLFNNAGIGYSATIAGVPESEFRRVMDVNFWGVVYGTRAFLPYLEFSGDGHIINTSSVFGLIGFPGKCAYSSAKFAVRGFTETLSIELSMTGSSVRVTCVHPGGIKTNIARASKVHPSVATLGIDVENAARDFERNFRVNADAAAKQILRGVEKNQRRILIGNDAWLIDWAQRLLPATYQSAFARFGKRLVAGNRGGGAGGALKAAR